MAVDIYTQKLFKLKKMYTILPAQTVPRRKQMLLSDSDERYAGPKYENETFTGVTT
jgi:hypothetical protein